MTLDDFSKTDKPETHIKNTMAVLKDRLKNLQTYRKDMINKYDRDIKNADDLITSVQDSITDWDVIFQALGSKNAR